MTAPLLEVEDLRVVFPGSDRRRTLAVDGVSFSVERGKTLGIVGESGCGKSVTSLAVMGLLPKGGAEVSGRVNFEGRDLLREPDRVMRDLRGNRLAMIFQEPMTSLNPSYTVGDQIVEAIVRHRKVSRKEAEARGVEMLRRVRIPTPEARFHDYPHRLSGGMRQRVMIAMALACDPDLLIADEPTTALDVTIQAQILELMRKLREESGAAIILITHDLGVVAEVCDEVVVMYAGQVVERASVDDLFRFPEHPYTVGLLGALAAARAAPAAPCGDRGHGAEHDRAAAGLPVPGALPVPHPEMRRDAAARSGRRRPPLALLARAAGEAGGVIACSALAARTRPPSPQGRVGVG